MKNKQKNTEHKGLSIFHRLLVYFLSVVLVIAGLLTVVFYTVSTNFIEKHTEEDIRRHFSVLTSYFDSEIKSDLLRDLRMLASNQSIDEYLMASNMEKEIHVRSVERLFRQALREKESYDRITFVNHVGKEVIKVDRNGRTTDYQDLSGNDIFLQLKSGTQNSISVSPLIKDPSDKAAFSIGIFKRDSDIGEFGGYVLIGCNLDHFLTSTDSQTTFGHNLEWVFNLDRDILKRPKSSEISINTQAILTKHFQEEPMVSMTEEGMLIYQDLVLLPETPFMRVAFSIPSSILYSNIRTAIRFFSIVCAFTLFITVLIVISVSKHISRPIKKLSSTVKRLAEGDLNQHIDVKTTGEIGLLVESFNQMARDINNKTVSKDYVDNMVENMINALLVVAPDGKIIRTNKAAQDLLNYRKEELNGFPMAHVMKRESSEETSWLQTLYQKGSLSTVEKACLSKDGKEIPVLFSASIMYDTMERNQGIVCVAQDITNLKIAEQELKDSKKFVETVLDSMKDDISIIDAKTFEILDVNRSFLKNIGLPLAEVIGQSCYHVTHHLSEPCSEPEHTCPLKETLTTGDHASAVHLHHVDGDQMNYFEVETSPIKDAHGDVVQVVHLARNVNDRINAEIQLKKSNKRLLESNQNLQDFANIASHDLQEPLRKVMTFSDRLMSKYADRLGQEGQDFVARLQHSTKRMQLQIRGLLAYSRISSQAKPFTSVDLFAVTNNVVSELEKSLEKAGAIIQVDKLPTLEADPHQIHLMMYHLIHNAIKFHREGQPPKIKIYSSEFKGQQHEPSCTITVEDNGIGLDEKFSDRIFSLFQRLHNENEYEGTGVGLSLCKRIVDRHGGTISVNSHNGNGTTFVVTLPLVQNTEISFSEPEHSHV